MMTTTSLPVHLNTLILHRAERVLAAVGMDISTAFNVFLAQVVQHNAIPFSITATPEAIEAVPLAQDKRELFRSLFGSIEDPTFVAPDDPIPDAFREILL